MLTETSKLEALLTVRRNALQQYTEEHNTILLFCWKIRQGLFQGTEPDLMVKYTQAFYRQFLFHHIEREEKYIFSKLPTYDPEILKLKKDHVMIERIIINIGTVSDTIRQLRLLASELRRHVLIEERFFFERLEENLPEHILLSMMPPEGKTDEDIKWDDPFW
ncbi:MAG TPA: hypothetical protein VD908_01000 [Cytophagales bacterium]|nr:hypothetical protein [Cytophagales bacterium]